MSDEITKLGPPPSYIPRPSMPAGRERPSRQALVPAEAKSRGERLEDLVDKSLGKVDQILDIPLIPGDDEFARVLYAQKDMAISVLNTSLKADENRFRQQAANGLARLLDAIERHEKVTRGDMVEAAALPASTLAQS